jgi:hypothetical protein
VLLASGPDDLIEEVSNNFVTIGGYSHPLPGADEGAYHAGAGEGFSGSRGPLNGKNAFVKRERDSRGGLQHRLALHLQALPTKSRGDCHEKIARCAMLPGAFHPVFGDTPRAGRQ